MQVAKVMLLHTSIESVTRNIIARNKNNLLRALRMVAEAETHVIAVHR